MTHVLIFHLPRFGYLDYATSMIEHLPIQSRTVFVSKYRSVPLKVPFLPVPSYRNGLEFLLFSLFFLPKLMIVIRKIKRRHLICSAWFSGLHYWDLPLLLFCKNIGIRTFFTVHDGELHEGENNWLMRMQLHHCIKKADELIFLSKFVQDDVFTRMKKPLPASTIIPHGLIDLHGLQSHHVHRPKLRLLFLGRIGRYKGVELLLEAVQSLDSEHFEHLTVAGNPLYEIAFPQHPNIKTELGWLSNSRLAELLNSHDVLVLPYLNATQSGLVTLGIGAAIPMICTRAGALPEQLEEDEAFWVEPTAESIRQAIVALSENRSLYQRLHEGLLEKKQAFSWEHLSEILAQKLLGGAS